MLFWARETMITNAYIIFKDMLQSPGAITHLQRTWELILTGDESLPASPAVYGAKMHPVKC